MSRVAGFTSPAGFDAATAGLEPPFGVLDVAAWSANADVLVRRAAGKPVRVASKSVRSRPLLREVLARPGFAGILAFTLPEALWLAAGPDPVSTDVVVGYPTADVSAVRRLVADPQLLDRVTVMVDDAAQLHLLAAAGAGPSAPVRVCLELDASLELASGAVHLGVRRSPVRTPAQAASLAAAVVAAGLRPVGLMAYEAQVAGLQDDAGGPAQVVRRRLVQAIQARSMAELVQRRGEVVTAVREVADLEFVNGGGTGSVDRTSADPSVTEIAAGSGLFTPTLFDGYRSFEARPASFFALPVVRRPAPDVVTVLGGGWIASGPSGADRSPTPVWPAGLRMLPSEGAGEVQTPLKGAAASGLRLGDRVWFRHAKAGELSEHLDSFHLLDGAPLAVTGAAVTYRGEGRLFI